jgi:hypothetical protein
LIEGEDHPADAGGGLEGADLAVATGEAGQEITEGASDGAGDPGGGVVLVDQAESVGIPACGEFLLIFFNGEAAPPGVTEQGAAIGVVDLVGGARGDDLHRLEVGLGALRGGPLVGRRLEAR